MLTTVASHKSEIFFLIVLLYCGQQLGLTVVSLGKSKLKEIRISFLEITSSVMQLSLSLILQLVIVFSKFLFLESQKSHVH